MRINKHYNDRKIIIKCLFPCKKRAQEHMWLLVGYEVLLGVSELMHISINSILILYFLPIKSRQVPFNLIKFVFMKK